MTAWNFPVSKEALNRAGCPWGFRSAEIQILVSMTALITTFPVSDFFYGRQNIRLYILGTVLCGFFVYLLNNTFESGLPFTRLKDFNRHNLTICHFDRLKRSKNTVLENGLDDLRHIITTFVKCFMNIYHNDMFISKVIAICRDLRSPK